MKKLSNTSAFEADITASQEGLLVWNQEEAILDTAELICELMERENVSRKELADRMKLTKGRISQMLDGTRNMTLRTVSDIFTHLGHKFRASCAAREEHRGHFKVMVYEKLMEVSGSFPMQGPGGSYDVAPHAANPVAFAQLVNCEPFQTAAKRIEHAAV